MKKINLKKIAAILMSCLMVIFTFGACSASKSAENREQSKEASAEIKTDGKVLVVYFSGSGNTERAAKAIAEASKAYTFVIEPSEPYTEEDLNYRNSDSRVNKEHENESLQDVSLKNTKVSDWESYDTVFIGYPIWWGIAAWPVNNFVKSNDFNGKTVIPFATSTSSGMGDSGKNLKEMAKTGNWLEGKRFASDASEDEITKWVEELQLKK